MNKTYNSGQTWLEFSGVAVAFLLIVMAMCEMVEVVLTYNSMSYAAKEATRYAMAYGPNSPQPASTAAIQQEARNALLGVNFATAAPTLNITVAWAPDPVLSNKQDVTVTISDPYQLSLPFLGSKTINLTSTSQMMASQ